MDGSEPKQMESVVDMSFLAPPGAVMGLAACSA